MPPFNTNAQNKHHRFYETNFEASLISGGRRLSVHGLREYSRKGRSLKLFEVGTLEDETADVTFSEEDKGGMDRVATKEVHEVVTEESEGFGTLIEEEDPVPTTEATVKEAAEGMMTVPSIPRYTTVKPWVPSHSIAPAPIPEPPRTEPAVPSTSAPEAPECQLEMERKTDIEGPAPILEEIRSESPRPSSSSPKASKIQTEAGREMDGPAPTLEDELEFKEASILASDEEPAREPTDHSSTPSAPSPAPEEPSVEPSYESREVPSVVPEEQPDREEAMPSTAPKHIREIEEPLSSPRTATEKQLEIEEVPSVTPSEQPKDIDESTSSMIPLTESDVDQPVPESISPRAFDIDETPDIQLEEQTVSEASMPSVITEESFDIKEHIPTSQPIIETVQSLTEPQDGEESIPTIEPLETSDTEEAIPSITPEPSLDTDDTLSGAYPLEIPYAQVAIPSTTPDRPLAMAPDVAVPISAVASERSSFEHVDRPPERAGLLDTPAPAPMAIDIRETVAFKPCKTDVGARRPPETREQPRHLGLRTLLPVPRTLGHSLHRHPVLPETVKCDCPSDPETKCATSREIEPEPTLVLEPVLIPETVQPQLPSNNILYYSPMAACNQVCAQAGESYQVCTPPTSTHPKWCIQERAITCRNFIGIPVPLTDCQIPPDLQSQFYKRCNTHICGPRHYIILFEWSTCPQKCATVLQNGTVIPNQRFRDYECRLVEDGSVVGREDCDFFIRDLDIALTSDCHSRPCERYGYQTSNWSDCDCQSWKRHRDVTCRRWLTGEAVDDAVCLAYGLIPPETEQYCYPTSCLNQQTTRRLLQKQNDHCRFTQCSTKGDCSGGSCVCEDGYEGVDCQMDKRPSTECQLPSLLNANGDCCASGVLDLTGGCCEEQDGVAEVDIDGQCCRGSLDACGRCHDKPHYLDAAMQCCEVLDASGTCCASGVIDECGICDGLGRSCDTSISITIVPDALTNVDNCASALRAVVEDALDTKHIAMNVPKGGTPSFAFSKTHVSMTTGYIAFKLKSAMTRRRLNTVCQVDGINIEKLPVCGNGFCEIGEPIHCPEDCDYVMEMCSVQWKTGKLQTCHGHGQCAFVNGSHCECHTGYEGHDCSNCSPGFFRVDNQSHCVPTEAMRNRPTLIPPDAGDDSSDRDYVTKDVSFHGWRYWPVSLYFLLILVCLIVVLIRRHPQREEENERQCILRAKSVVDSVYDPAWTSIRDQEPFFTLPPNIPLRGSF